MTSSRSILYVHFNGRMTYGENMVLKTGSGREPEREVVPVLVVRPGSDRWSNR
jgi:hypothetical protein